MTLDLSDLVQVGLALPSEIVVAHPDALVGYLRTHPAVAGIVGAMAVALVEEFRGERSSIELRVDEDDYLDEQSLIFLVRAARYDEAFMDRLNAVAAQFDDALTETTGWVLPTTDFAPVE